MKTIVKIILVNLAFMAFQVQANNTNYQVANDKEPKMVTDTFEVTNMNCHDDANIVERRLYRLKGVKKVRIVDGTVIVTYNNTKTNSKNIIATIEDSGTCTDPNDKTHKATKK